MKIEIFNRLLLKKNHRAPSILSRAPVIPAPRFLPRPRQNSSQLGGEAPRVSFLQGGPETRQRAARNFLKIYYDIGPAVAWMRRDGGAARDIADSSIT